MAAIIDPARCPQNHPCPIVPACPAKAVTQQGDGAPEIDVYQCTGCGKCARMCPAGAFTIVK